MKKIILTLITAIFLVSLASAAIPSIGPFAKGNNVNIIQTCTDGSSFCDLCNITSVKSPTGDTLISEVSMTKSGNEFIYELSGGNTTELGKYVVNGFCELGSTIKNWGYYLEITQSGASGITEGAGLSLIGSLLVMFLVAGFFFIISFRVSNGFGKFAFLVISAVLMLIVILYSVVMVQQNLGEFESIVSSYETFYFVIKMFFSVGIVALSIIALLVSIRYYKFKRGWID